MLSRALHAAVLLVFVLGCSSSSVPEVNAQIASAQSFGRTSFQQQAAKLCPLGNAVVWQRPFTGVDVAIVGGEYAGQGQQREYVARITYWCRGDAKGDHESPLEGHAVAEGTGSVGQGVVTLTEWKNESFGEVSTLLGVAYFCVPTLVLGVLCVLAAASDVWIWLATDLWWLVLLRFVVLIPAVGVPLFLIGGIGGAGWWAYQVFHSAFAVVLSPLLSLPIMNLVIRLYLKQVVGA